MLRFLAGAVSAMLLMAASFFAWKSWAGQQEIIPPPPPAPPQSYPSPLVLKQPSTRPETPPAAPEKSKEEKRFARADKDDDGKITKLELFEPRRKAFAKLDTNGNGSLSFEEWAVKTADKFAGADSDRSGFLTPAEYSTTAPKPRAKPRCNC
jgi:hypothetical protein